MQTFNNEESERKAGKRESILAAIVRRCGNQCCDTTLSGHQVGWQTLGTHTEPGSSIGIRNGAVCPWWNSPRDGQETRDGARNPGVWVTNS